jgi:hypothetical protein
MFLWSLVLWVEVMDYISLVLEVEGIAYGCYVKYGRVPKCLSAPTSPTPFPKPKNLSWHPKRSH